MPDPSTRADDAQKPVDLVKRLDEWAFTRENEDLRESHDPAKRERTALLRAAAREIARLRALSGAVPTISEEQAFKEWFAFDVSDAPQNTRAAFKAGFEAAASPVAGVPPEQGGGFR